MDSQRSLSHRVVSTSRSRDLHEIKELHENEIAIIDLINKNFLAVPLHDVAFARAWSNAILKCIAGRRRAVIVDSTGDVHISVQYGISAVLMSLAGVVFVPFYFFALPFDICFLLVKAYCSQCGNLSCLSNVQLLVKVMVAAVLAIAISWASCLMLLAPFVYIGVRRSDFTSDEKAISPVEIFSPWVSSFFYSVLTFWVAGLSDTVQEEVDKKKNQLEGIVDRFLQPLGALTYTSFFGEASPFALSSSDNEVRASGTSRIVLCIISAIHATIPRAWMCFKYPEARELSGLLVFCSLSGMLTLGVVTFQSLKVVADACVKLESDISGVLTMLYLTSQPAGRGRDALLHLGTWYLECLTLGSSEKTYLFKPSDTRSAFDISAFAQLRFNGLESMHSEGMLDQYQLKDAAQIKRWRDLRLWRRLDIAASRVRIESLLILMLVSIVAMITMALFIMVQEHMVTTLMVLLVFELCVATVILLVIFTDCMQMNRFLIDKTVVMLLEWKEWVYDQVGNDEFPFSRPENRKGSNQTIGNKQPQHADFTEVTWQGRVAFMREMINDSIEQIDRLDEPVRFFGMIINPALRSKLAGFLLTSITSAAVVVARRCFRAIGHK